MIEPRRIHSALEPFTGFRFGHAFGHPDGDHVAPRLVSDFFPVFHGSIYRSAQT